MPPSYKFTSKTKNNAEVLKQSINNYEKAKDELDKAKDFIREKEINSIELLGIFVSIFTFVSIEFQIFRSFTSWQAAASLTFIILGCLSLFLSGLNLIIKNEFSKTLKIFSFLSVSCLVVGIYFFGHSKISESDFKNVNDLDELYYNKEEINKFNDESTREKEIINCLDLFDYFNTKCLK